MSGKGHEIHLSIGPLWMLLANPCRLPSWTRSKSTESCVLRTAQTNKAESDSWRIEIIHEIGEIRWCTALLGPVNRHSDVSTGHQRTQAIAAPYRASSLLVRWSWRRPATRLLPWPTGAAVATGAASEDASSRAAGHAPASLVDHR